MPVKPTTLPEWATSATVVEPSLSQKQTGWVAGSRPPAPWENWRAENVYNWIQYVDDPVGTGTGPAFDCTGGATDGPGIIGRGGGTNGAGMEAYGVGTGNGITADADGTGHGGYFTNSDSTARAVEAVSVAGGQAVKGSGGSYGCWGIGSSYGISGQGASATNGGGGLFQGTGTGPGVRGEGDTSGPGVLGDSSGGAGYGVVANADTSSPTRSAFRMVPQDADPGTAEQGDVYVHNVSGLPQFYDGNGWRRGIVNVYAAVSNTDTLTSSGNYAQTFVIPKDSLRVGSVIRIRAMVLCTAYSSGTATQRLLLNGNVLCSGSIADNGHKVIFESDVTIRSLGASGKFAAWGKAVEGVASAFVQAQDQDNITVDTTSGIVVKVQWQTGGTGVTMKLVNFTIDIS